MKRGENVTGHGRKRRRSRPRIWNENGPLRGRWTPVPGINESYKQMKAAVFAHDKDFGRRRIDAMARMFAARGVAFDPDSDGTHVMFAQLLGEAERGGIPIPAV